MKIAEVLSETQDTQWALMRQAGVSYAVGRLPTASAGGASWEFMDLLHMKQRYADYGLKLEVLEPGLEMPLHHIKLATARRDEEIAQVQRLIRHMGKLNIPVLCYNFMAYFNWMRTSLAIPGRGGALVTGYDHALMQEAPLTEAGIVTEEQLWERLAYFLQAVVPVAEEAGVRLALHPCDPPISPIRGIARIITSAAAMERAIGLVPSPYSGVAFCQGTFATAGEDIPALIRRWGAERIFYVHFRDVQGTPAKFVETFHDEGKTDMYAAIAAYHEVGFAGPVRVDHVPTMEGEQNRDPGYASIGRLYALGYLKGLIEGASKAY